MREDIYKYHGVLIRFAPNASNALRLRMLKAYVV